METFEVPIGSFVVSAAGPTHLFTMGPSATVNVDVAVMVDSEVDGFTELEHDASAIVANVARAMAR
jgi:hypothetical protein